MSKFNVKKVIATLTLVGGLMAPGQHVFAKNISVIEVTQETKDCLCKETIYTYDSKGNLLEDRTVSDITGVR